MNFLTIRFIYLFLINAMYAASKLIGQIKPRKNAQPGVILFRSKPVLTVDNVLQRSKAENNATIKYENIAS